MKTSCLGGRTAKWILAVVLFPASLLAEPVSLKRVVELALSHANGAAIAAADEQSSRRQLSRTQEQLHPSVFDRRGTRLFLWISSGA